MKLRPVVLGALVALWTLSPSYGDGVGRCFQAKNPATEFGQHKAIGKELSWRSDNPWQANPGVRYFRALVEIDSPQPTHWSLVVRDKEYRPIQVLGPADLDARGRTWTRRIAETSVFFDLSSQDRRSGVAGSLVEAIFMGEEARFPYYSVQSEDNPSWQSLYINFPRTVPSPQRRLGDYVALLMLSWDRTTWSCSGVVVGPHLLLTNWHCGGFAVRQDDGQLVVLPEREYWNRLICQSTLIDLSWDGDDQSREYRCDAVIHKDRERDLALLRIRSLEGETHTPTATLRTSPLGARDAISLVHHALAEPKLLTAGCEVARAAISGWKADRTTDCSTEAASCFDFTHTCDSEAGSSGAPIFDTRGRLAGLHHLGFPVDENCQPQVRTNRAIRIGTIRQFLTEADIQGTINLAPTR